MPERDKAAIRIATDVVGHQTFDGRVGQCVSMPDHQYRAVRAAADVLFERIVTGIDFNRILLTASVRHGELMNKGTHPVRRGQDLSEDELCGACLTEELLTDETFSRAEPSPRRDTGQDWAAVFAASWQQYGGGKETDFRSYQQTEGVAAPGSAEPPSDTEIELLESVQLGPDRHRDGGRDWRGTTAMWFSDYGGSALLDALRAGYAAARQEQA